MNNTKIATYGQKLVETELNHRHSFKWELTLDDVQHPIIGSDFLAHFGLLIDLKNHCLIDPLTNLTSEGQYVKGIFTSVKSISNDSHVHKILTQFPNLTHPRPFKGKLTHNTYHFIETSAHLFFASREGYTPHGG